MNVAVTGLGATTPLGGDVPSTLTEDRAEARRLHRCEQVGIGTGTGGVLTLLGQDDDLERSGARQVSPRAVTMPMANGPAAVGSLELGARGAARTPVSDCASGAEAIALATGVVLAGFAQAAAHSTRNDDPSVASRPFDATRDRFAAVVVLEHVDFAPARATASCAVPAGAGVTSDAHHLTPGHTDGQIHAGRRAIADSFGFGGHDACHAFLAGAGGGQR
ncbi:beta-ketoacyl synthase N-terminal-like domain-containing protein [Streptomyces sp. NPDC088921]|uniref:beta-ketoacyl synthase N-terminal-like domain-containing protein n=1 Tax=unclassified Streptomyces TaxID=2593676 RepID=UPI003425593B